MSDRRLRNGTVVFILSCALMLSGCGGAERTQSVTSGDAAVESPAIFEETDEGIYPVNTPTGADGEIVVTNVDELLAAIGPDRTIFLEPGVYNLTNAQDYGRASVSRYYEWRELYDGFGLYVQNVKNLAILGHSANDTGICTDPRYASVLSFESCENISVGSITAGHTDGQGQCTGSVLYFESTDTVTVTDNILFGCGTLGLDATDCKTIRMGNCTIKECSLGAVSVARSRDVQLQNCRLRDSGDIASPTEALIYTAQSEAVAVVNCTISNNKSQYLLKSSYSRDVSLLGSMIENNRILQSVFLAEQYSPVVADCAFVGNTVNMWYGNGSESALSGDGVDLTMEDLLNMQQATAVYEGPAEPAETDESTTETGTAEVYASTVDEFLAGIASNTTIYLEDGVYDFSQATDYGAYGTDCYYWFDEYDGPGVVIFGVSNLRIVGSGASGVSFSATPRYADVLAFEDCENITITGVTLGHSEAPGECTGDVLQFSRTKGVSIQNCVLYGCGVLGVNAYDSGKIAVDNTEIYDCSQGAGYFYTCSDVAFTNCDIHDCGEPLFGILNCSNMTRDGEPIDSRTE